MIGLIEGDDRGKDRFVSCRIKEESPDLFYGGWVFRFAKHVFGIQVPESYTGVA